MSLSSSRLTAIHHSSALHRLVGGAPAFAQEGYDPDIGPSDVADAKILVVGAGGIGCELLHLLALSGFGELTVIDMDTIELSNLNRQFLFREKDIGQPKSTVAAAAVERRCKGVRVHAVFGRIEDQPDDFFRSFMVIVMGVDSITARRWMNEKVAKLAQWEVTTDAATPSATPVYRIVDAIPLIDTGTEGFAGHCRVINMANNATPCVECEMYLFEAASRQAVPMCTLENIPRVPEHCVLYAKEKLWPDAHPDEELDGDNVHHIRWVTEKASVRQREFGIGGAIIDEAFTLGVVKNVVPAVAFTNALVAAQAVTEVMKLLFGMAPSLDNYSLSDGGTGLHFYSQQLKGVCSDGGSCHVCAPRPCLGVSLSMTPLDIQQAVAATAAEDEREAIVAGTFSLLIRYSASECVTEVFLKRNAPPRVEGRTVGEILSACGEKMLLNEWQIATAHAASSSASAEMNEASAPSATPVTLLCTAQTRSSPIYLPVRCCAPQA